MTNCNKKTQCILVSLLVSLTLLQTFVNCQKEQQQIPKQQTDEESTENEVERPATPIDHISANICEKNQCLVVGMQTYSEPRCVDLGKEGDFCRPEDWVKNATLYYPHKILEVENIFTLFCPCSTGLECVGATCKRT